MRKALLWVLVFMALQMLTTFTTTALLTLIGVQLGYTTLLSYNLILSDVLLIALLLVFNVIGKESAPWHNVQLPKLCMGFVGGMSIVLITGALCGLLDDFLPDLMEDTFADMSLSPLGLFAIVLLGPLTEELLFRGAVINLLQRSELCLASGDRGERGEVFTDASHAYSESKVIFFSALLFGVFHLNPSQILPAFLIGLVLAWLRLQSGSLLPGLLVHVANNGLSCYLSLYYPDAEQIWDVTGIPMFMALLLAAMALSLLMIRYFRQVSH